MRNTPIAFIPQWIEDALARKGLSSEILLDFEKASPLFSIEDLATLVVFEAKASIFTGINVAGDTLLPLEVWRESAKTDKSKKMIVDIATLAADENFAAECIQRLSEGAPTTIDKDQKETFEISLLGDKGVKVVIKQGYPVECYADNALNLFRSAVKKLYVYEEYHLLISRNIGKSYIESLLR